MLILLFVLKSSYLECTEACLSVQRDKNCITILLSLKETAVHHSASKAKVKRDLEGLTYIHIYIEQHSWLTILLDSLPDFSYLFVLSYHIVYCRF